MFKEGLGIGNLGIWEFGKKRKKRINILEKHWPKKKIKFHKLATKCRETSSSMERSKSTGGILWKGQSVQNHHLGEIYNFEKKMAKKWTKKPIFWTIGVVSERNLYIRWEIESCASRIDFKLNHSYMTDIFQFICSKKEHLWFIYFFSRFFFCAKSPPQTQPQNFIVRGKSG